MDRLSLFNKALESCERLAASGQPVSRGALSSIVEQLRYLISLETGASADRSRLSHVNIGALAARELDDVRYEEVAELLFEVAEEARFPSKWQARSS